LFPSISLGNLSNHNFWATLKLLLSLTPLIGEPFFMQQPNVPQSQHSPYRATLGMAFSVAGALLILIRGIIRIVAGDIITFVGSDEIRRRFLTGIALNLLGGVAVAFAIIILVGAYLMYTGMPATGGTIVIIFSLLSILVGSGWLIGLVLGVIGGILGVLKK